MKKLILFLSIFSFCGRASAQQANITLGKSALEQNNYKQAIEYFDAAVQNEQTRNNPDAWYWRGKAYMQIGLDSTTRQENSVEEAARSLLKTLKLKPDYNTDLSNAMYTTALMSYNQGVSNYQKQLYGPAYDDFMRVVNIYKAGGEKRFASNPAFAVIIPDAKTNAAYAAINDNRVAAAQVLYEDIIKTQTKKNPDIYQALIELYQKQNKTAETFPLIKDARKQFPTNKIFRDLELNYYIITGKQAELLPLLEAAVKEEPENPELLFNVANAYMNLTFPKDAKGNPLPPPANFKDIYLKTEDAYKKAAALKPEDADFNYNAGVLYYNNASMLIRQMNAIKGNSRAENKKMDELTILRDAELNKVLPYFERSYAILAGKPGSMSDSEKVTYQNTLTGLKEIYTRLNNTEKADEIRKKLDQLK